MRNLKRALALALSSVMLMGMMVVGTSAAGYPDVTASHDAEAIEVMQAIEVMVGDDQGNFNPDQKVTRAEAAVVIAKMMDMGVIDFNGADLSFTDVPEWAAPFVAACQVEGIVAGYNATTFGSNDTVTAVQYALMVMKTLGYFQYEADYGDDWVLATAKQAAKIDLFDKLDVSVNAPLTREQVARITLNALQCEMVDASSHGLTIESDDLKITSAATYYGLNKTLMADLFEGDLKKFKNSDDAMGRPAVKWVYNKTIGTYAEVADEVVIADKAYTNALVAYQKLVDDEYKTADGVAEVYKNGNDASDVAMNIALGDKIEYFLDKNGIIETAVVTRYSIDKIDEIDTEITKAHKADDVTCYVYLDSAKTTRILDTEFAGFAADTYVEDAYILVAMNEGTDGKDIIASEIPATVEGEVKAVKAGNKLSIDGEYYTTTISVEIGAEGTYYLGLAEQVMAFEGDEDKSENYAFVRVVDTETETKGGLTSTVVTAYLVLADGTTASYEVEEDSVAKFAQGDVIAYTINDDGELVFATAADKLAQNVASAKVNKDSAKIGAYKATAETEFVFWTVEDNKVKVETATGYKNVDMAAATVDVVYDNDTKAALYVFVEGTNAKGGSDAVYGIVCDADVVVTEDADDKTKKYYTYTITVDGVETEIVSKSALTLADGGVYYYELDKDGYVESIKAAKSDVSVDAIVEGDYIVLDGKQYDLADVAAYTVITEYEKDGVTVEDIYVKSGADIEAEDTVYYGYDADGLIVLVLAKDVK